MVLNVCLLGRCWLWFSCKLMVWEMKKKEILGKSQQHKNQLFHDH